MYIEHHTLNLKNALKHTAQPSNTSTYRHGYTCMFNIYILPLFSYLHNFYIMPDSGEHGKGMGEKIRAHIQKTRG